MASGLYISIIDGKVVVSDSFKRDRSEKGHSLIELPESYTLIDIESTGLDPTFDEIIELGALKIKNNKVKDSFQSLVKPESEIDPFIEDLTGITNSDLEDAPSLISVLPAFLEFIGSDLVVGHNVNFDINFIYDNCKKLDLPYFSNDYVDTLRLSRRILPELESHSLSALINYLGLSEEGHHRAISDCEKTKDIFDNLKNIVKERFGDEQALRDYLRNLSRGVRAKDIVAQNVDIDKNNPLYDKYCVFTGTLEKLARKDAFQIVADFGGIPQDSINKQTNFLILGTQDYRRINGDKSSKQKKAEQMKLKGKEIDIIPETVFYDMIEDYLSDER
ncbi:exonuclease [Candidatus Saccharibacteria bacterium]|nr:exonuclease [Candidatus Saccharibacteria bacterium]